MKTKRKFTVVIEQDEDGYYVATVPALRGCHTQAKTLDTLMKRVREVAGGAPLAFGFSRVRV
jgi:predicted RNase H-like HicB family nuclease